MSRKRRQEKPNVEKRLSSNILLLAALFLSLGFSLGFFISTKTGAQVGQRTPPPVSGDNREHFFQDEAALLSLLRTNPQDVKTLIELGNLYYDHGRFQEAVEYYGQALVIDPNNVNVRTDRGTSYWNQGQADLAIAEFNRSLLTNPTHPQTLYNLGVVHLNGKHNPAAARKAWEALLLHHPDYPERVRVQAQLSSLPTANSATRTNEIEDLLNRMQTQR